MSTTCRPSSFQEKQKPTSQGEMTDGRLREPRSPATTSSSSLPRDVVSLASRWADDHLTLVRVGVRARFDRWDRENGRRGHVATSLLPRSRIILLCSSRDFLTRGWAGGTSHQHSHLTDSGEKKTSAQRPGGAKRQRQHQFADGFLVPNASPLHLSHSFVIVVLSAGTVVWQRCV